MSRETIRPQPFTEVVNTSTVETVSLTPEQYIDKLKLTSRIKQQEISLNVLLGLFGIGYLTSIVIMFLQGFQIVSYPETFINWLGGVTIGETGVLPVSLLPMMTLKPLLKVKSATLKRVKLVRVRCLSISLCFFVYYKFLLMI